MLTINSAASYLHKSWAGNFHFKIFNGQVGTVSEGKFSDEAPFLIRKDAHSLVALAGHHVNVLSDVSIIHTITALVVPYCSSFLDF